MDTAAAPDFTIPARYYARGKVDWNHDVPARGNEGEKTKQITLNANNTAIVCMHCPNVGMDFPGAPQFICDPEYKEYFDAVNSRREVMVNNYMVPLFDAARSMGIRVMYVMAGWKAAEKYESYREISSRIYPKPGTFKPSDPPGKDGIVDKFNPTGLTWRRDFFVESCGSELRIEGDADAPPQTAPQKDDWVITWTPQATTLLHEAGIWNVIMVGTDASGCLITTDAGIYWLNKHGFRVITVEDCTESAEFPDTVEDHGIRGAMLRTMQVHGRCYLTSTREVLDAIAAVKGAGK